ncbi:MAG: Accessory regulator [Eubacterium sp.]|jgi:accessory gene regulator B|nr:Accessory regulator [Eubacterium sp.]
MRFINKWSYACAKGLSEALNENHQKRREYNFGFQIIIGEFVKFSAIIIVSLIFGVFLPALVITLAFVSLRMIAGGYHMDTQGKCLLVTLGLFIPAALIAKYTCHYWNTLQLVLLIFITFIAGLYALIRYAPRDNPNKPITEPDEILKFKKLSLGYLFVWLVIIVVLTLLQMKLFVISLGFGVLLELFMITQAGHKFFDLIKYRLGQKRK